jgi:hypothetical protein
MLICQATVCTVYLVIGVVVYTYCGSYVASPALGSAGPLMKKVCYGLALPGLLVSGTMVSHVSLSHPIIQHHRHPTQTNTDPSSPKVPSKIHLRPRSPQLPPLNLPDPNPLHYMAPLHLRHRNSSLHHRQRRAEFQQPDSPHRRPAGDFHLFPADGLHVVVRQLEP